GPGLAHSSVSGTIEASLPLGQLALSIWALAGLRYWLMLYGASSLGGRGGRAFSVQATSRFITLPSAWSNASTTLGTLSARARTQRSKVATPMICRSGMRTSLATRRTWAIGGLP